MAAAPEPGSEVAEGKEDTVNVSEEACGLTEGEEVEDGWDGLMGNNVRKRTLVEGNGKAPEVQQDVYCDFEVLLADDDSGEVLQRREGVRYRIGEGEAPPAVELALRYMSVGEESEVRAVGRFAWAEGWTADPAREEKDIPANADVLLRMKLVSILPQMDMGWDEQMSELKWRKEHGNEHFKRKNHQRAVLCWEKGVTVFAGGKEYVEIEGPESFAEAARDQATAEVRGLMADCHANMAAVKLEQDDILAAQTCVNTALQFRPDHTRALYRKAKVELRLGNHGDCEDALRRLTELQPQDAAVRRIQLDLRAARQKYATGSKRMAAKVMSQTGDSRGGDEATPESSPAADAGAKAGDAVGSSGDGMVARSRFCEVKKNLLAKAKDWRSRLPEVKPRELRSRLAKVRARDVVEAMPEYELSWSISALLFAVVLPDRYAPPVLFIIVASAVLFCAYQLFDWIRGLLRGLLKGQASAKDKKKA